MVRIAGSHPAGPGSIPGNGKHFWMCERKCNIWTKLTTRMGFEPTRAEPIGLAVQRLNHSATSSISWSQSKIETTTTVLASGHRLKCLGHFPIIFFIYNCSAACVKRFPTPGVEPGPPGWKPDILAVRPRGIMFPSGIEPETFCVLGRCDNRYTTETL